MYAVAIDFFNSEARNGAYSLDREKFELWQKIRRKLDEENRGIYKEFKLSQSEELEIDLNDYFIENTDNFNNQGCGCKHHCSVEKRLTFPLCIICQLNTPFR